MLSRDPAGCVETEALNVEKVVGGGSVETGVSRGWGKPRVERFNTHKTADVTISAWTSTRKKKPRAVCKSP